MFGPAALNTDVLEQFGIRMSYGLRGNTTGLWVDNRYKDILVIGFCVRNGVYHVTYNDGDYIRTVPVEQFKKSINHENTGRNGGVA